MNSFFAVFNFKKRDRNTAVILLSAPVLLTIYRYHGYARYFGEYFPSLKANPYYDLYSNFWQFGVFFVLMFFVPFLIIRLQFKQPLKNFGFTLGDVHYGLKFLAWSIPLLVIPLIFIGSRMPDVRVEYLLANLLLSHHEFVLIYELSYIILYYIAWEFFFRGFLLFGLKDKLGNTNAILIQTISSCLVHIGKPEGEIVGAIFIGIIFGALALRTRSIWYVFVLHVAIGLFTDLFIIYL